MPTPSPQSNMLFLQWMQAKEILDNAKVDELSLRVRICNLLCPEQTEGTTTHHMINGYLAKVIHERSYGFTSTEAVRECLLTMADKGDLGTEYARRVVQWSPRLVVSEYKKMVPEYRDALTTVITCRQGPPRLEAVAPKGTLS